MPGRSVDDERLAERLLDVFREVGFEGASLSRISEATGLGRSSLYHHFPRGKEQMAERVAERVAERFAGEVLAAAGVEEPLVDRIEAIAEALDGFYEGGRRSCVLDTLTVGTPGEATSGCLRAAARAWIGVFASLAGEAGVPARLARERAEDAVCAIEGALVVARATGDTGPFRRALATLGERLTARPDDPAAPATGGARPTRRQSR